MKNLINIFIFLLGFFALVCCAPISKKIDETTEKEKLELTRWLNQKEVELKNSFGQPNKIEFLESGNRNYVYISEKYKISCERKFEINPKNIIIAFSSKNCF